ncbi:protein kinase domain-containing protein [Actinomycetospora sp. CA-101289]|uniref:protein kinase domain-containing protein n=1 Tax=Actinomycetospora sp. CA-101289 TaxID=3239893 RepID=UPI003D98FE97
MRPTFLERYELGRRLERNPAGEVYAGYDHLRQRAVAIELFTVPETGVVRYRRRRHVQLLAGFDHPALLSVHDVGQDEDGRDYVVWQLVEGLTLAERIALGPQPLPRVLGIGAALADALAHVHAAGLIHREVTPAAVRLQGADRPVLHDLRGAARSDTDAVTLEGPLRFQARYLAPEQTAGGHVGAPADIYALGQVLLACLHHEPGELEHPAPTRRARPWCVPSTPVPAPVAALLAAMTAADPAERPTAAEAAAELDALAQARLTARSESTTSHDDPPATGTPDPDQTAPGGGPGHPTTGPAGSDPPPDRPVKAAPAGRPRRAAAGRSSRRRRGTAVALIVAAFAFGFAGSAPTPHPSAPVPGAPH